MGEVFDRYTDTVGNYHYSDTETGHHVIPKNKYEYHYDHTDCIWYRPEARNRCPATCAQYRDGWTACVTTTRMSANEARKLERKSKGFCGYDWMIRSIIKHGDIRYER